MAKLQHRAVAEALSLSRRSFLIGMAGATVAFGFARTEAVAAATLAPAQSAFEPTIWYSIDRDGIVTVNIIRAEMGQHVGTALARMKPIPQSDRFVLFYWSDIRGRWRTFGDLGRLRLTLDRANEVFRNEPIFHSHPSR